MELDIHGLKCDACPWEDMSIPYSEYKNKIGAKCPDCCESILTQEEFDQCEMTHTQVKILNQMSDEEHQAIIYNASLEEIDLALDLTLLLKK